MRERGCLIAAAYFALIVPATAEPVSTAIGLTALLGGTAFAGAVGGFIVSAVISAGISFVASLFTPRPTGSGTLDDSANQNSNESRYSERQALPYKRVILGSAYVGGALFFEKASAPYLYLGFLLNHGKIAGIDKIWIGTNQLSFSGGLTFNSVLTPSAIDGQPAYSSYLRVSLRDGNAGQAIDPLLAADWPSLSSTFRQRGIATAVFRFHYGGTDNSAATQTNFVALWGQVQRPNVYLLVRGVPIYDPRDPTQRMDDETTWKWSNNASLCQAYYLTRDWGGRIPLSLIRWDKVTEAANYDDEMVGCKDRSFIKRYTVDGLITLNQKPSEVLQSLLTANRGSVIQSRGLYWVSSSKPKTPIATIHDGILAGALTIQGDKPKKDKINKLQTRSIVPQQTYQTVDLPILERDDLQATDEEVLTASLTLPFTLEPRTAQRLQKAFLETSRVGRNISVRVDIAILADLDDDLAGNAVTFDSALFPAGNGTFLVTSVGFADDGTAIDLTLVEYDARIETNWHADVDEKDTTLPDPFSLAV